MASKPPERREPERRMKRTGKVTISVGARGKVQVSPYWAKFRVGDPLVIECAQVVPWAVGFHGKRTPTDALVIQGNGALMGGAHRAQNKGHFPYTVAAVGPGTGDLDKHPTIYLDAACPEIIIE